MRVSAPACERPPGSRRATTLSEDVYLVAHHARGPSHGRPYARALFDAKRGLRCMWSESMCRDMPVKGVVYKSPPAFIGKLLFVMEMLVSRQVSWKHVLFARGDHSIPHYGQVNPDAHFRTSQFPHMGLIVGGRTRALWTTRIRLAFFVLSSRPRLRTAWERKLCSTHTHER